MKRASLAGLLALAAVGWGAGPADAQQAQLYCRQANGGAFLPVQPGQPCPVTIAAGTAVIGSVAIDQTTPGVTNGIAVAPSSAAGVAITSVVSPSAEATRVLKNAAGNLYSAYATNLTGTAGFLVIVNATSAPADGAITPLACVPLPAGGVASINYAPGPAQRYSTGITAVVSSATTCFTKTTSGGLTAFIGGAVQ
jgi:hypothetical protein